MPEQAAAAAKKTEAPADAARDKATATGGTGGAEGAVALAGIPALLRPGVGFAGGGGRVPPPSYAQLQRRAGNRAVSGLITARSAQSTVQRNVLPSGDIPDEVLIADAIKFKDQARIKMVKKLGAAKYDDKISMIEILTKQFWVGPADETALETLWGSFGDKVLDEAKTHPKLWEDSLKGGAELYNLKGVKHVPTAFLADTRAIAGGYLDTNETYTVNELKKLGVTEGGEAAPSEADQAARLTELTAAVRLAKEATDVQAQLRTVPVALERRYEMFPGDRTIYFTSGFDPQKQPDANDENPPSDRVEKAKAQGMTDAQLARTPWKDVKAQWDMLEAILQGLAIAYPTVGIALTQPVTKQNEAGGDDPKKAKAAIVEMLTGARDSIRKTRPKLAGGLAYELVPIHNSLFNGVRGASGIDWKDPVYQTVAKEVLELKQNVEFWKTMGLATLAAAAFILAEFATAGLATAALVGFGVGLGAGQAIVAWEKALEMQTAEKATTGGGTELLASGQASMATFEAALATVMVFVDAFMAAKPLGKALSGAVDRVALAAGAKAGSRIVEELAALAGKAPDKALAERAITELGAETVISKSGKSASELLAIVGEDSVVAARLKALSAIPADIAKLSVPELSKRARQLAVEIATNKETGEAIAALAVERFGPKQVLEMNGGWKNLSLALGNESAAGKSIMAWRDGAMGDIEAFVKTLPGGVDETGKAAVKRTGSQGKFTNDFDVSLLGPHASANRNAVRSFAAGRFGTSVDRLNELLLADFFTDPRRLHLYDQLDPLLRAEIGQRAEKVAEATIFSKTLHDAEEAGNKELAAQIREQMKTLGVEEVPFKPLSEGDRAALYTKIDDFHQQLEQAVTAGDKAAQKDLVGKIGDSQGLINATEGGGYFSGGATRQIVTLAEGLLKGAQKPLDAQVYTTLLDQLPKLNEAASGLLKTGVVAGEDAVASIKGIAKYGNRFRELMAKLDVKVADEAMWNNLAERLQKLLHEAKGETEITLLQRLESDAKAVESEVNGLMGEFRAASQEVLTTLSRQAAMQGQRVDLNAIQFLVMATAKLTRANAALRESLRLIVAQMVEAATNAGAQAAAPKSTDNATPAPPPTPPPGGSNPGATTKPGAPPVPAPAQRSVQRDTGRASPVAVQRQNPPASTLPVRPPQPNKSEPPDPETLYFEGHALKFDRNVILGVLRPMQLTKGLHAPAEFAGRLKNGPMTWMRGTERPGLYRDILTALDEANAQLNQEREDWVKQFEAKSTETATELLRASKKKIEDELARMGITGDVIRSPNGGEPDFRLGNAAAGAALRAAARDLIPLASAAEKSGNASAAAFRRLGEAQKTDPFNLMNQGLVAENSDLQKKWLADEEAYEKLRKEKVNANPALGMYADEPGASGRLTALAAMDDRALANSVGMQARMRLSNIESVLPEVGKKFQVWHQPHLTRVTLDAMNANAWQREAVSWRTQSVLRKEADDQMLFTLVAIGLGLLAAIPTMGSGFLAVVGLVAATAGAGISLYNLGENVKMGVLARAANGTAMDKAEAISDQEPEGGGLQLALDILSAVADVFGAAAAYKALSGVVKAARAGEVAAALRLGEVAESVGVKGAARQKIVSEAVAGLKEAEIEQVAHTIASGSASQQADVLKFIGDIAENKQFQGEIQRALAMMEHVEGRIPDTARDLVKSGRVKVFTEESLIETFGEKLGKKKWNELGYAGGFYSPKRDIVFIRAGNSPEELAGVLIHEATHRVGKANPLRGNNFLSEAVAEFAERDFYLTLYMEGGPMAGRQPQSARIRNFISWSDEELLADIEHRYFTAKEHLGPAKQMSFISDPSHTADEVVKQVFTDIAADYKQKFPHD